MLKKVDIREALQEEQNRSTTDELLVEVHDILLQEAKREDSLRERLHKAPGVKYIDEGRLDPRRVFDLSTIRRVAIRYRLRFLDTKFYRNEYPHEAIRCIKHLEDGLDHELTDFKILAPAAAFELCDADTDPLLFVPVGRDRYYLIYKWGKDLNISRRIFYWPLRRPRNLFASLFALAVVLACLVPTATLSANPSANFFGIHRIAFLIWTSFVIASISVYLWFAFFGKFGTKAWNDQHFN